MVAVLGGGAGCIPGTVVTTSHEIASFAGRVVSGSATHGTTTFDCTWLDDGSGRRLQVIYPPGWDDRFNPTRIIDATGAVFAREGDLIRVTYVTDGIGESVCPGLTVAAETVERVRGPTHTP
jgi:hypothetical protein